MIASIIINVHKKTRLLHTTGEQRGEQRKRGKREGEGGREDQGKRGSGLAVPYGV